MVNKLGRVINYKFMIVSNDRFLAAEPKDGEEKLEVTLRPKFLSEYIGQIKLKENLSITIKAAKERKETIEHVLLYGAPGLGKTTLAHVIANETKSKIRVTSGPAIEKGGDLAAILSNLEEGDILFIDEIHRLPKIVEEILYPAMEDFSLDIVMGKGPSAKTLRLDLPKFTIIGATTLASLLSAPLRDRFGIIFHLNFYHESEIEEIVIRSSKILEIKLDNEAALEIAKRSRKTPRVANRLLKRVRDYCQVKHQGNINPENCLAAFKMLGIDDLGLDEVDRRLLLTIAHKFNGGPVGLNTLAAASGEEAQTIENIYEPYLMQLGFLNRSARGRVLTGSAYKHLNLKSPENNQLF